jgi:hypothetical protein
MGAISMRFTSVFGLAAIVVSSACGGGSTPPPAEAPPKTDAPKAEAPKPEAEAEAPKPEGEEAADQPGSAATKPTRTPIETLTAAKMAFVINFSSSAMGEAVEAKCDKAAGDDPKKRAACIAKEKGEFLADVIQFKKDDKDKHWLIIYRRKGSALTVLSRSEVQFSDEKENSVAINVIGKDKAPRVLFTHKNKFTVTVPNDYSIELDDPRYKKLVYDAKIDIVE